MTREVLSRGEWRREQVMLLAIVLLGGGGLAWFIGTRDWPGWAQAVLLCFVGAVFSWGGPSTYRAYLRDQEKWADMEDLLSSRPGVALQECRVCGRHTYLEEPACVRCGAADSIPNAAASARWVRFLMWVGMAMTASAALTIVYLLIRALVLAIR